MSNEMKNHEKSNEGRAVGKVPLAWETLSDVATDSENNTARVITARTILELSPKPQCGICEIADLL